MERDNNNYRRRIGLAVGLALALGVTACGGPSGADDLNAASRSNDLSGKAEGPLDPVQAQLAGAMDQVFAAGPAELATAGPCFSDALVAATDVPDALLAAGEGAAAGEDPAVAFEGGAGQAQASLMQLAESMQQAFLALSGSGACDAQAAGAPTPMPGNPLRGTPFEEVGAALDELIAGAGQSEDPNLRELARAVSPALSGLSAALGLLSSPVADTPVLGGLLSTLQQTSVDLRTLLLAAADYDAPATAAATEAMVGQAMRGILLGVVPVEAIDEATGQDVSGPIEAAIVQAEAAFGDGLGQLITPLFADVLDGALAPALDPVEAGFAQILERIDALPLGEILAGG